MWELLTNHGTTLVPYPLYCHNIILFLKLKYAVKGKSFHNIRTIQEQAQAASAELPTQMLVNASNSGEITGLPVCWHKEIALEGNSMEKHENAVIADRNYCPETF